MPKQTLQTIIDDIFAWLPTFVSYLVLLSWQSFLVCVLPRFFLSYIPLHRRISANICHIGKCHFFQNWPHWRIYVLLNSNYHSRITQVRNRHWSFHMICELSAIGTYSRCRYSVPLQKRFTVQPRRGSTVPWCMSSVCAVRHDKK